MENNFDLKMYEERKINSLYNLTEQISWDQNEGKLFLKIWVAFDSLKEFVKFMYINFESTMDCTLLESSVYMEIDDFNIHRFFDFKNVQEFIDKANIEKY